MSRASRACVVGRLVTMLAGREIPLIEDDLHGELYFGHERPRVARPGVEQVNRLAAPPVPTLPLIVHAQPHALPAFLGLTRKREFLALALRASAPLLDSKAQMLLVEHLKGW